MGSWDQWNIDHLLHELNRVGRTSTSSFRFSLSPKDDDGHEFVQVFAGQLVLLEMNQTDIHDPCPYSSIYLYHLVLSVSSEESSVAIFLRLLAAGLIGSETNLVLVTIEGFGLERL